MANKKITDLMSGTPTRDSLLESAIDISGTMDSRKVTTGAIADLASANVAAPYNSATNYAIGQYCLYEGNIYRCIAITTGTFDATKWTQIVVTSEFRRVVELTTAQYEALSSAEQNNGTLYILTDGIPPSETVTGSDIITFIDVDDSNKPKSTTAAAVAGLGIPPVTTTTTAPTGAYINSKLTDVEFYMAQQGRLVSMSLIFKVSSNLNAQEDIFTSGAIPSNMNNQQFIATIVSGTDMGKCGRVMLKDNGSLSDWYNASGSFFTTGKTFLLNATYLCKSV